MREPGRRRVRRTLLVGGVALVLVAAMVVVGGIWLVRRYEGAVGWDTLLDPSARARANGVHGPLNLLLIGSDERAGDPGAGQRSDTIIVAHVSRALDQAYLISVPRDLLVDIPSMPSVGFGGERTKINAAFEYGQGGSGGARLVSATLTNLMGIQFDGAAVINFNGLKGAVDSLGGVDMFVDTRVESIHTKRVFEPGCRTMTADEALDFLRQRDFPDGDYTRQRHQQQFLKAFLDRATRDGVVNNPVKLDALVRSVAGTMTVDTGGVPITDLALGLRNVKPDRLIGIKIPSLVDSDGGSYVVTAPEADGLFSAVRTDTLAEWTKRNAQWVNKI